MGRFYGRLVLILLTTGAAQVAAGVAHGQLRQALTEAARAFDDAALRRDDDNAKPTPVRKRTAAIRLAFSNAGAAPSLVDPTRQAIREIAAQAVIDVVDTDATDTSANFLVRFDDNESPGGKRNCFARSWWNKGWSITRNELKINPASGAAIDACIIHEAMHAFGFNSHPHGGDSVLSYVYRRRTLTDLDRHLIRTLYDPRLTPGMPPRPASGLGCRILGERLTVAAADIDAVCSERNGPTG